MPWNILYYHDGESIFCTQFVSVYGYSGLNIGGKNYFKTPIHPIVSHRNNRGRDVAYEHTEFTSGKEICKAASDAGISLYAPSEGTFFHFADYRTDEVNKLKGEPSAKNRHRTFGELPHLVQLLRTQPHLRDADVQLLQEGH